MVLLVVSVRVYSVAITFLNFHGNFIVTDCGRKIHPETGRNIHMSAISGKSAQSKTVANKRRQQMGWYPLHLMTTSKLGFL